MRPPLSTTFDLPTRAELLALTVGDQVKLWFHIEGDRIAERMWLTITKQQSTKEWAATLDDHPYTEELAEVLKVGTEVIFHPLDIIGVE